MRETNLHHLYWERRRWNAVSSNKLLRNDKSSQIELHVPAHRELHCHVEPLLPPIIGVMAKKALELVHGLETPYSGLDAVRKMADTFEENELFDFSEHLNRQIPYIELSVEALRKRVL